MRVRIAVKNAY